MLLHSVNTEHCSKSSFTLYVYSADSVHHSFAVSAPTQPSPRLHDRSGHRVLLVLQWCVSVRRPHGDRGGDKAGVCGAYHLLLAGELCIKLRVVCDRGFTKCALKRVST